MASAQTLARLDTLIWVLIFGGLLTLVLGLAVARADTTLGWILGLTGGVLAVVGGGLIVVRSRLRVDE